MKYIYFTFFLVFGGLKMNLKATTILANSTNYTSYLSGLKPGDTLKLSSGNYTSNLTLSNISGTFNKPVVIIGNGSSTVFLAQSCCNTISLTKCAYLVIKNLQLDGQNLAVDALKAEGTANNFAHHITIEFLNIINYGNNQQIVGISTKCPAWNWIIRKNKIIGAGTGMYLGNSNGTMPFINGIIEYNYVANTIGYNIEIKHQINGQRELMPETCIHGKTIIRHNVFTKDAGSSTGVDARPNLLVGAFPTLGYGEIDFYEIYGNFFYNNPVEALFQGTGNIKLYNNIFVNHYDPSGFSAVYITPQNGVSPLDVRIFHNTVLALNSSGGLKLNSPSAAYKQYCYGNAVFAPLAISNFSDTMHNITSSYAGASAYVISPSTNISTLDLYPLSGKLTGSVTPKGLFQIFSDYNKDFNHDAFDWTYRGAYSGCCTNKGWKTQFDTMSLPDNTAGISKPTISTVEIFPNPAKETLTIRLKNNEKATAEIYSSAGIKIQKEVFISGNINLEVRDYPAGIYLIRINNSEGILTRKFIKL